MKTFFALLLTAGLLTGTPLLAKTAESSPLAGKWAVDVSRIPVPPEARPKSVTITFGDAGGKWSTQVDIANADGTQLHAEGTAPLDGTPTPVTGSLEADITAVKMPSPHVLVMQLGKGGVPASTRIYTVAADGKTMVETVAYFGQDGKPILRTNYFTRVR